MSTEQIIKRSEHILILQYMRGEGHKKTYIVQEVSQIGRQRRDFKFN